MSKVSVFPSALALGMCLALSPFAQAQSRSAAVEGPYIGVGAGITNFSLKKGDFTGANATTRAFDERDKGFKLFGGYRLNENFAVEAQFANLGESTIRYGGTAGAIGREEYKTSAISLTAMGLLPVGDSFTLFAKAGPSYNSAKSSFNNRSLGNNTKSSRMGLLFGAGASFSLTDNLSLRAELENYSRVGEAAKAGRSSVRMLSAGVAYRF